MTADEQAAAGPEAFRADLAGLAETVRELCAAIERDMARRTFSAEDLIELGRIQERKAQLATALKTSQARRPRPSHLRQVGDGTA